MKNKKGFTLIEIMIAIAIIGILALVLIPRVATMKNQAKLAGIDTNLRIAQGVIENIVANYEPTYDADKMTAIEDEITSRLGSEDSTKGIKNPITGQVGTGLVADAANSAFVHQSAVQAEVADDATFGDPGNDSSMAGVISYDAYWTGTTLKVRLVPYDDSGNRMTGKIKIIAN